MLTVLLPVDGSEPSAHAAAHVVHLKESGLGVHALLLNVQAATAGRTREERRVKAVADFDAAERATRSAVEILERGGLRFRRYTRFGSPADVILKFATHKNCDQIVIGTRGRGAVAGLVLGSVAMKVLQSAPMPVTVVK